MKTESFDILKEKLVKSYRKYGDKHTLTVMNNEGIRKYTGNEIADEVENETPFGINCIHTIIGLTIDLLSRDKMKYEPNKLYEKNIGKRVCKDKSDKPFKSGFKCNVVKGVIDHPILHVPAYTFEEDDSYVECRRCKVVDEKEPIVLLDLDEHQVDTLNTFNQEKTWKVGTTKADYPTMRVLETNGLIHRATFANGEFWCMTNLGIEELQKRNLI